FAQGYGFARGRRATFFRLLAEHLEHAGYAIGGISRADHLSTFGDGAGEHAHDRHLAAVRGMRRLHHISDGFAVGRLYTEPLARCLDPWRFVTKRFQEPLHAVGPRR